MLYQAIRLGCQKYHCQYGQRYDKSYEQYIRDRVAKKWTNPGLLDFDEVKRLILFANSWKCRINRHPKNVQSILEGLIRFVPTLNLLNGQTLLDVSLDSEMNGVSISDLIAICFNGIATAGMRCESVGTSKMIHAAVNPSLFVMWDRAIKDAYGVTNYNEHSYARFLREMQRLSLEAVQQVIDEEGRTREDAITSLTPCGQTLAKVMDEFNYVCFTAKDAAVRMLV